MTDLSALRRQMLTVAHASQEGHLGSSFSVTEILTAIYDTLETEPESHFCLSKGHAALALYAILADRGLISPAWAEEFCQPGSIYEGHPNHRIAHVLFTGGSLGLSIGCAAGLALGLKIQNLPGRVFCVVGDTECNEGSVWETALLAYKLRLNNFVLVVDDNTSSPVPMLDIARKFEAFGWTTRHVDGHHLSDLRIALSVVSPSLPTCIVAKTVKGYGCAPLQDKSWHHRAPQSHEINDLLRVIV